MQRREILRTMAGMAAAAVLAAMPHATAAQGDVTATPAPRPRQMEPSKPDPNDPRYAANAYAPRREMIEGAPLVGEFAEATDGLKLRERPSYDSRFFGIMPRGGTVSIEGERRDGFSLINHGSQLAWVDAQYLRRLAPELQPVAGVGTLLESTPIYKTPETTGEQVATWRAGIPVSHFGEVEGGTYKGSKRWLRVMTNPDRYVSAASVANTATAGLQPPPPLPMGGPLGWVGTLAETVNVRSGPGTKNDILKTWGAGRRVLVYGEAEGDANNGSTKWYQVATSPEQPAFLHSSFVRKQGDVLPVEQAPFTGRWMDINLSQQVIVAYLSAQPIFMAQVATGLPMWPTEEGAHASWWRLVSQRMQGENRFAEDYYNLDSVPYIQYFHSSGEAIHGCYWHDNFGQQASHGCVNTSIVTAQWLLQWAPLGTKIMVHQ